MYNKDLLWALSCILKEIVYSYIATLLLDQFRSKGPRVNFLVFGYTFSML